VGSHEGSEIVTSDRPQQLGDRRAVVTDGRRAVSASFDRTLRVWDLERGRQLVTLEGHHSRVRDCAVAADGRRMVSASYDRNVAGCGTRELMLACVLEGHDDDVKRVRRDGGW